jgi:hypothetical protein
MVRVTPRTLDGRQEEESTVLKQTSKAKTIVKNLTPGLLHYFKHQTVTGDDTSPLSEAMTLTVR